MHVKVRNELPITKLLKIAHIFEWDLKKNKGVWGGGGTRNYLIT